MCGSVHPGAWALCTLDKENKIMSDENGTGSNAVWAIALIVVVAIIAGVLYYTGVLRPGANKKTEIDINVTAPAAPPAAPAR